MFFRQIDTELKLSLTIPQYAEELFALTDRNRDFLKQWLPWPDSIKTHLDTRAFIEAQLQCFQKGEALHVTIFYRDQIAGVLGYNQIDAANGTGLIGYWLGQDYNGRGIMRRSVQEIIDVGFEYYALNRVEIRCAVGNAKSRAIPESLGFAEEGIARQAEKVNGAYLDLVVYGLLRKDRH